MALSTLNADIHVNGTLSAKTFNPPANSVANASVASNAAIAATKLEHQFGVSYEFFAPGTAVTAVTAKLAHIVKGVTGEIVSIEAVITTQATGADRTVTVDLEKSTGGGAFATVLSSTVDITNATVIRTPVAGTITTPDTVDGDILQWTVAVAGAAGNQAEGLLVTMQLREDAA